ncbi:hypothetical protein ALC57_00874 [Trachymyrmex cornetzi]|uniref:Uncharacterized protein n=1 Tax=Trachymyrmex cornetzi TaxID=471704 RepID=A0A195ENY0_9HYME|nr:hypothetical protein ALC57_00874 [Trachymyrmex cornetzi]
MHCFDRYDTHVRQPVYPEPLGRPLLAHAVVAEVELAVGQLFNFKESRQTVSQTAHFLLLLRPASLQSVRYVQRKVLERLVRLRVRTTVHTVDLREETRSIIRPRFSQEENEEERDFGKRHQSLESAEIPSTTTRLSILQCCAVEGRQAVCTQQPVPSTTAAAAAAAAEAGKTTDGPTRKTRGHHRGAIPQRHLNRSTPPRRIRRDSPSVNRSLARFLATLIVTPRSRE